MIFFKSTSYKTLSKLVNIIFKNKILTRMCTHVSRQIKSNQKNLHKGLHGHHCLLNHCLHTEILKSRLIIPYYKNLYLSLRSYGTHIHVEICKSWKHSNYDVILSTWCTIPLLGNICDLGIELFIPVHIILFTILVFYF